MSNLNKITISGNLTKDPTFKSLPSGQVVAAFRIASSRKYKKANGEEATEVTYVNVDYFPKKEAEGAAEALLKKGAGVVVKGALTYRTDQKDGKTREFYGVRAFEVGPIEKKKA